MASIRQRPGRSRPWEVRFWEGGKQRSRSFRLKSEAKKFAAFVESQGDGVWSQSQRASMTLGEWASRYVEANSHRWKARTIRNNETLREHVKERLDVPLRSIRASDLDKLVADMLEEGFKPSTVGQLVTFVRAVVRSAVRDQVITDPFVGYRVQIPRSRADLPHHFLTAEQVAQMVEVAERRFGEGLLFDMLVYTGARVSALLAVRKMDVDTESWELLLRAEESKSGEAIRVPIVQHLRERLLARLDEIGDGDEVFPAGYSTTDYRWQQIRRELGWNVCPAQPQHARCSGVRIHDLRHTCASLLKEAGADVKDIQLWLGHKTLAVTADTYTHLFPSRLGNLAERLSEAQKGAAKGMNRGEA